MNEVVEKYPKSTVAEMAGMIVNGVKAGRQLRGGKFNLSNVWQRRTAVMADSDSIKAIKFSPERNTDFTFMIVYQPDSVDQNRLLFELAKYNFTSYLARNFEIEIEQTGGLNRMKINGFSNYDEALQYARAVYQQKNILRASGKHARTIIISDTNIPLLGVQFSYDDYDKFYASHFAPLKTTTRNLLEEPSEIVIEKENGDKEVMPNESGSNQNGGILIIPETKNENKNAGSGTVIQQQQPTEKVKTEQQGTVIVPQKETKVEQKGTVISPKQPEKTVDNGTIIVPEQPKQTVESGVIIIPEQQKKTETKQQDNAGQSGTIIVPQEEKAAEPAVTKKTTTARTQSKASATTKTTVPIKSTSTPNTKPQKKKQTGEVIYFDDGFGDNGKQSKNSKTSKTKKEEKKKKEFDLEDEYYDLKGF
jgi:hypothetical protein